MMKMRDRCAGWNCRWPKLWYANSRSLPAYKNRKQSALLEPLLDVGGTASFSGLEINTFRCYTKLQVQAEPDYSFLPLKAALCCCSHEWLCLDSCNLVRDTVSINTSAALCWSLLQLQWWRQLSWGDVLLWYSDVMVMSCNIVVLFFSRVTCLSHVVGGTAPPVSVSQPREQGWDSAH